MPVYEPLHIRSAYSLGRGTARVEELAEQAALYGHHALALTDRNGLYGAIPFVRACEDWGVRPILGAEVDGPEGLVVLLARDRKGYAHLCRILTQRKLDPAFSLIRVLGAWHEGLHVLTAAPALLRCLAPHVPRGSLWGELAAPARPGFHAVVETCADLGLETVATGAVAFLQPADFALHATLAAVRENKLTGQLRSGDTAPREAAFKAPAAMASLFRDHRRALENSRRVAESCDYVPRRERWILPRLNLSLGDTPQAYLRRLCDEGMERRYGRDGSARRSHGETRTARGVPADRTSPRDGHSVRGVARDHGVARLRAVRRLEHELGVIEQLGFTDYFVIVGDIVRFARERGIATVGRGSGAAAITSYLLGITNVDPIRHGLCFERFLHAKRPDCPDLDVDFCWKRRDEVIAHVYEAYGRERVAMISTHTTFQVRSAFRDAARAHGIPLATVNRLAKTLPRSAESMEQALAVSPRARDIPRNEEPWPRILHHAGRLLGLPRHLGVHPGGLVIADRPLDHYVPLEKAAKGIVVTQYEMRAVEAVGLVKMDLLGNRALSTIQETVDLVERRHGTRLDPDAFAEDDPDTGRLFAAGDTLGVFQMESPGMRNLNRMLRTRDLEATIAAVALIRPGPAGSGMKERYVRCARGLETPRALHPRLEPVLRGTYGLPLYEEDVMRVAAAAAGVTLEDGDMIRRAIASSREEEREEIGRMFRRAAERRGFTPGEALGVWEDLLRFGTFAFCKAHAAGYGMLAYQTGWLKAHYPVEFTAALLNHHAGMYDKRTHLQDAQRRGVRVLLPCVNRSRDTAVPEGNAVRVGLEYVRGLSDTARSALLAERKRRAFAGLEDFLCRVSISRPEAEAMILGGVFDGAHHTNHAAGSARTRPQLLCALAAVFEACRERRRTGEAWGGTDLFNHPPGPAVVPALPDFDRTERLWLEWHVLGLCVGDHPVRFFRGEGALEGTVSARRAEALVGRRVRVAGIVAARRVVSTRKGESMQFITLEDETGMIECTLFPEVFRRYRNLVRELGPYVAEGRVEDSYGAPTLTVDVMTPVRVPRVVARTRERVLRAGIT